MAAPASTADGAPSASRPQDAMAAGPTRNSGPAPATDVVLSFLVGATLAIALPPTGRFATERLSPLVSAQLQALCAASGAAPVDLGSALCSSMMRSRIAVLARR